MIRHEYEEEVCFADREIDDKGTREPLPVLAQYLSSTYISGLTRSAIAA